MIQSGGLRVLPDRRRGWGVLGSCSTGGDVVEAGELPSSKGIWVSGICSAGPTVPSLAVGVSTFGSMFGGSRGRASFVYRSCLRLRRNSLSSTLTL